MSLITIGASDVAEYHGSGVPAFARLYANQQFTTSEGIIVAAGSRSKPTFYQEFSCSLVGTAVRIASGTAYTTTDSRVPGATYTLVIYDADGNELLAPPFPYTALRIPPDNDPTTWKLLEIYSEGVPQRYPSTYLDSNSILAIRDTIVNGAAIASDVQHGVTKLSLPAADLNNPIAVGDNDPRLAEMLGWINVTDAAYGAIGNGIADDTAAIQAAINAAVALKSATIYFPAGTYLCNGALQGTLGGASHFSVLRIPAINGNVGWASIEFRGPTPCALFGFGSVSMGTDNTPVQGAVIKSTGDGGNVFGAEPGLVGGAAFCAVSVTFQNISILTKDNPTRGGVDAFYCLQLRFMDSMVHTGKYGNAASEPTTAGITGVTFPTFFNATLQVAERSCVAGYYDGWRFSELATGTDLIAYHCKRAWVMAGGSLAHALHFGRLCDSACEIGIATEAATHVTIEQYDAERAVVGWYTRLYDIDASGGTLQGGMNYHIPTAGTGIPNKSLLLNAATATDYFTVNRIGEQYASEFHCAGTTQTLVNNGYVLVEWTTQGDANTGFLWAASPDPEQIVVNNAGIYNISASVAFQTNATGFRQLFLYRSGVFNSVLAGAQVTAVAGEETIAHISATLFLSKGDYIGIQAHQNSGITLDVEDLGAQHFASKLMIAKVG